MNVGEERRYIVEFANFIVLDETGCDICGSDEVAFIIRTRDYALLSSTYGDLDSSYLPIAGDYGSPLPYRFKRCAVPAVDGDSDYDHEWECDQSGRAPPLSFTIAAWEDDGESWPSICTNNLPSPPDPRASGPDIWHPNQSFCVEDRGELIGKAKVELKLEDLGDLDTPGDSFLKEIDLIGGCDASEGPCSSGGSPHYRLR